MEQISQFFANTYLLFLLIAAFAVFALIGFIAESKNKGKRRVSSNVIKPVNNVEEDLEKIKSNLANSNKSLNSVLNNQNGTTNTFGSGIASSSIGSSNGLNQPTVNQGQTINFNSNIDKL